MAYQIQGLAELNKQLQDIVTDKYPKAMLQAAIALQRYSMELTPVRTGFLRNSHTSRQTTNGAEMEVQAEYAGYVEFGTKKQAAKPYVRPAIDQHQEDIVKAARDEINREIRGKK